MNGTQQYNWGVIIAVIVIFLLIVIVFVIFTRQSKTVLCTTNSDCGKGYCNSAGLCQNTYAQSEGQSCSNTIDCQFGLTCSNSICVSNQTSCRKNSDCPSGDFCNSYGLCVYGTEVDTNGLCTTSSQCRIGTTCSGGQCITNGTIKKCQSKSDCPSGDYCNGQHICVTGLERAQGQPCINSSDCTNGNVCGNNKFCQAGYTPALGAAPTLRDARIGLGAAPSGTGCTTSGTCSSGQVCIANICTAATTSLNELELVVTNSTAVKTTYPQYGDFYITTIGPDGNVYFLQPNVANATNVNLFTYLTSLGTPTSSSNNQLQWIPYFSAGSGTPGNISGTTDDIYETGFTSFYYIPSSGGNTLYNYQTSEQYKNNTSTTPNTLYMGMQQFFNLNTITNQIYSNLNSTCSVLTDLTTGTLFLVLGGLASPPVSSSTSDATIYMGTITVGGITQLVITDASGNPLQMSTSPITPGGDVYWAGFNNSTTYTGGYTGTTFTPIITVTPTYSARSNTSATVNSVPSSNNIVINNFKGISGYRWPINYGST